jgi:hypothetical protein
MVNKSKGKPVGFLARIVAIAKANTSLTREQIRGFGRLGIWCWNDPRQGVHKYHNGMDRTGLPKKMKKGSKKPINNTIK